MTDVKVNNISVTFKVDTGAEVKAISESTLQNFGSAGGQHAKQETVWTK